MIRSTLAPAKINLSLRVLGRRADGFHDLASIVAFSTAADQLSLHPQGGLSLEVEGPFAAHAGPDQSNLVLRAARALQKRIPRVQAGRFILTKNLPAGAGLGGGSSDAAAALRLLALANGMKASDPQIVEAAAATGSDVPVCIDAQARLMHGRGEVVSEPLDLPVLPAVLVFPGTALETAKVFGALDLSTTERRTAPYGHADIPRAFDGLMDFLAREPNDLEPAARNLVPAIGHALEILKQTNPLLTRMSGSGSAVFGIYATPEQAAAAARSAGSQQPDWWITATSLH